MEEVSSEGALTAGYMRVPWPSWDHWDFVRTSLFSSNPDSVAAALDRIRAWRSRGCLPMAIQVTASIVEIRHNDPFFSKSQDGEAVYSEEMLSMLYSMAITRFVNGFVEKVRGFDNHAAKHALSMKKQSISKLADALGIPRILVDIRHEGSHRDLPSLPLLRLAISKALDWLKSNYWESQKSAIPDVRKEVKCRLRQLVYLVKNKHSKRTESSYQKGIRMKQTGPLALCSRLSTGKLLSSKYDGPKKQISRILKVIARLYSVCPEEVTSSLLEFYMSRTPDLSSDIGFLGVEIPNTINIETLGGSEHDLKSIIIKLSRKRPGLLLRLLKEVLEMIEAKEMMGFTEGQLFPKLSDSTGDQHIAHLSSLVPWLLLGLRELKDSGLIEMMDENQVSSASIDIIPRVSFRELLRRCLLLASSGNRHLSVSALFLAEMTTGKSLFGKLKRLLVHSSSDKCSAVECCSFYPEDNLSQERKILDKAKLELDALRSRPRKSIPGHGDLQNEEKRSKKRWTLAKRWNPCPIGMLPCSFSSTSYLPVLDKGPILRRRKELEADDGENSSSLPRKRELDFQSTTLDNSSSPKKQRMASEDAVVDAGDSLVSSPTKGMLLIDGIWRKVEEDELQEIQDNIRIFAD